MELLVVFPPQHASGPPNLWKRAAGRDPALL